MHPHVLRNSTHEQAHLAASNIIDKKVTRKSHRQSSSHDKEIINQLSSNTVLNNTLHFNLDKKASKPANKHRSNVDRYMRREKLINYYEQ